MINLTQTVEFQSITQVCFDWCKSQHFANDFKGLYVIGFVLGLLIINYFFIVFHKDLVEQKVIKKEYVGIIVKFLVSFAMFTLIGFFVWFIWFS